MTVHRLGAWAVAALATAVLLGFTLESQAGHGGGGGGGGNHGGGGGNHGGGGGGGNHGGGGGNHGSGGGNHGGGGYHGGGYYGGYGHGYYGYGRSYYGYGRGYGLYGGIGFWPYYGFGYGPAYAYGNTPFYGDAGYADYPYLSAYANDSSLAEGGGGMPPPPGDVRNYPPDIEAAPLPVETDRALITVTVAPEAQLFFQGSETQLRGPNRVFRSPPLTAGKTYRYDVVARWTENSKPMERTRAVTVQAGQRVHLDLTSD
jgi:uncharacterized protein (TIGR03000 family)